MATYIHSYYQYIFLSILSNLETSLFRIDLPKMERHTGYKWSIHGHSWWRHQMEPFSALLALCVGNSPVTGESPAQRPVTRSFHAFFDLRLNKRLSKHSWGWWFETLSRSLRRHSNVIPQDQPGTKPETTMQNKQVGISSGNWATKALMFASAGCQAIVA